MRSTKQASEQKGCEAFCGAIFNNLFKTDAAGHPMGLSQVKATWRAHRPYATPESVDLWNGIDRKKEEDEQAKLEKDQAKQAKQAKKVEKDQAKQAKQVEDKRKAEAILAKSASDRDELLQKLNDATLVRDAAKAELDNAEQAHKAASQMAVGASGNPTGTKLALQMENTATKLKTSCEKEYVAKSKALEAARQRLKDHDSKIVKLEAKVRNLAENAKAKANDEKPTASKKNRKRDHTDISSQ